tara:strand:+ start:630 stop:1100 length:471 start_codon:yes stop_codon:yes gene_type:complete
MSFFRTICLCIGLFVFVPSALSLAVDEPLLNPALEARARALHKTLRCLVCQNQSIEDSDAGLARDLRRVVRERILAGDSDDQVIDYIVIRYGDWVLLRPPFKASTYALWFGPFLVLGFGAIGLVIINRRRSVKTSPTPLDDQERESLDRLLEDEKL